MSFTQEYADRKSSSRRQAVPLSIVSPAPAPAPTSNPRTKKGGKGEGQKPPALTNVFAECLLFGKQEGLLKGPWSAVASHTSGGEVVYRWKGTHWNHVGGSEGASLAAKWLAKVSPDQATPGLAESSWKFGAMRLRDTRMFPEPSDEIARIPCKDVTLEIDTEGLITCRTPKPEYGMTYAIQIDTNGIPDQPYEPKPLPAHSKFRQWLEFVLPDPEVQAIVQEQCGMVLLPHVYSIAAWWYGAAGSGKSTLQELCELFVAQTARTSLDSLGDDFALESLVGASLILVDENEPARWCEARFKTLVSGNGVSVNRKHEKALHSYQSKAKWIISSNDAPFVRDSSDGVWRRLCIIKYEQDLPQSDQIRHFHKVLFSEEGAAIFDWMLAGAQRLVLRGRFLPRDEWPERVRRWNSEVRRATDSVLSWVEDDNVAVTPNFSRCMDQIYGAYFEYCEGASLSPLEKPVLARALTRCTRLRGFSHKQSRANGTRKRMYNINWGAPPPPPPAPQPPPPPPRLPTVLDLVPLPVWSNGVVGDLCPFTDEEFEIEKKGPVAWLVKAIGGQEFTGTREEAEAEIAKRKEENR